MAIVFNPTGWQNVAGGRSNAETSGSGRINTRTPQGWQNVAGGHRPPGNHPNNNRIPEGCQKGG
jgi:hypothetical protein